MGWLWVDADRGGGGSLNIIKVYEKSQKFNKNVHLEKIKMFMGGCKSFVKLCVLPQLKTAI